MAGSKKGNGDTPSPKRRGPKPKPKDKKLATAKYVRHGLYCNPDAVKIDGRSFFGQMKRKVKGLFLETFKGNPSALVQTLADGCAANLIIAKAFQASFLRGDKLPPSILRDYTGLWNSISRDLATLSQMAKDNGAKDPVPSLEEYLKSGKVVPVEGEKESGDKPGQANAVDPAPPEPRKSTLF